MKKLIIGAALAAIACGCTTVNQGDGACDNLMPAVVKDVVHAKYDIGKTKVSGKDQAYCILGFIKFGSTASHVADFAPGDSSVTGKAKNGAYANACDEAKCDEIVAARYKVTTEDYFVFSKATAEVSGYPAKMTGIELIENKDPKCGYVPSTRGGLLGSDGGILSLLSFLF